MRNTSKSYVIFLKLYRCFGHGLKKPTWFEYNPQIISSLDSQLQVDFCVVFQALLLSKSTLSIMGNCLGRFRGISWNQTSGVHRGSTLIT